MSPETFLPPTSLLKSSHTHIRRQSLQIGLGYSIHKGSSTSGVNLWQGIRYAAPPISDLRWQPPQIPVTDRAIIQANGHVFKQEAMRISPDLVFSMPIIPSEEKDQKTVST
ncbi:hypothetical protein BDZ45DRAFT_754404 [Acephala macrosclerotiorum]|nr:hypothetical protein BDZ45DRAFT_754404 [Acephala macrosclerotiorum]